MKKLFRLNRFSLIAGLAFTGLLCAAYVREDAGGHRDIAGDASMAPLVL